MSAFTQDFIIQPAGRKKHKTGAMDVPARLWNPDGTPFTGGSAYTLPAAGTTPTKAEFDAVVTELNETKKKLNAALASLKAAGVIG